MYQSYVLHELEQSQYTPCKATSIDCRAQKQKTMQNTRKTVNETWRVASGAKGHGYPAAALLQGKGLPTSDLMNAIYANGHTNFALYQMRGQRTKRTERAARTARTEEAATGAKRISQLHNNPFLLPPLSHSLYPLSR